MQISFAVTATRIVQSLYFLPLKFQASSHILWLYIPVYQFILTPGQLDPRGSRYPRVAWPPGGQISQGILTPTLGNFTPGGQDTPAGVSSPPGGSSRPRVSSPPFFSLIIYDNFRLQTFMKEMLFYIKKLEIFLFLVKKKRFSCLWKADLFSTVIVE